MQVNREDVYVIVVEEDGPSYVIHYDPDSRTVFSDAANLRVAAYMEYARRGYLVGSFMNGEREEGNWQRRDTENCWKEVSSSDDILVMHLDPINAKMILTNKRHYPSNQGLKVVRFYEYVPDNLFHEVLLAEVEAVRLEDVTVHDVPALARIFELGGVRG